MKSLWLHSKNRNKLIIFCNGWGMDERPFTPLASVQYDVLMLYDYTDLSTDMDVGKLLAGYPEVSLIAWSMGVWAGNQIFSSRQKKFHVALALNGTLAPIHDDFGILIKIASATLENFHEKQRLKFYYRMCNDRDLYKTFVANQPGRSIAGQKEELASLLQSTTRAVTHSSASVYTNVVVARHDYIIPTVNQLQFWPQKNVRLVDGSHFLFYAYSSWDELLVAF